MDLLAKIATAKYKNVGGTAENPKAPLMAPSDAIAKAFEAHVIPCADTRVHRAEVCPSRDTDALLLTK